MRSATVKLFVSTAAVAALVAVPSALPASAGTGTSQTIRTVLNLPVAVPAQALRSCDRNGVCKDTPLTPGTTVGQLELLLAYTYTSGSVKTLPDVTSLVGQLVSTSSCNGKHGVRIDVAGAGYSTSGYSTNVGGGDPELKGDPKDVDHAEGVFVEQCLV